MRLGKQKPENDPSVRFPKRRETDLEAEQRAEELDLARMDQEDHGPLFGRSDARKFGYRARKFGQGREMEPPR